MNLPHLDPLIFAKDIISQNDNTAVVLCKFNQVPTLAMFIEASAQSSSAFNTNSDGNINIGFITMLKNIELLNTITEESYFIHITLENEIANIKQFIFE